MESTERFDLDYLQLEGRLYVEAERNLHLTSMISQRAARNLLATGLTVAVLSLHVDAQTSGLSGSLILRLQATSIAEETFVRLSRSLSGVDQIAVSVEGGASRTLVENAFLDLLGRKGIHASLQTQPTSSTNHLQLTVLDQSIRYAGMVSGEYRREVQTAIEARRTSNDSAVVEYLGLFKRQDVDTVAFREDGGMPGAARETERTLFDRLLGPVILIGGAFLIVYLFFTVRN